MVFNCCVKGCKTVWSPIRDVSFFSFPLKDKELLKQWQAVIQTDNEISKHSRICSNHFNPSSYRLVSGKRLLNKNAVPLIFNNDISENIQFQSHDVETPCSMEIKEQVSSKSSDLSNLENHPFSLDESIQCRSPPPKICRKDANTQISPRHLFPSKKEQELRRKLTICQRQIRRQKQKLTIIIQLLEQLMKEGIQTSDALEDVLIKKFSGFNLDLFKNHIKNAAISKNMRKYSEKMKEFASTLYFYSPKAYNFVRQKLQYLPHEATLKKWISDLSCEADFLNKVFDFLKTEHFRSDHINNIPSFSIQCLFVPSK